MTTFYERGAMLLLLSLCVIPGVASSQDGAPRRNDAAPCGELDPDCAGRLSRILDGAGPGTTVRTPVTLLRLDAWGGIYGASQRAPGLFAAYNLGVRGARIAMHSALVDALSVRISGAQSDSAGTLRVSVSLIDEAVFWFANSSEGNWALALEEFVHAIADIARNSAQSDQAAPSGLDEHEVFSVALQLLRGQVQAQGRGPGGMMWFQLLFRADPARVGNDIDAAVRHGAPFFLGVRLESLWHHTEPGLPEVLAGTDYHAFRAVVGFRLTVTAPSSRFRLMAGAEYCPNLLRWTDHSAAAFLELGVRDFLGQVRDAIAVHVRVMGFWASEPGRALPPDAFASALSPGVLVQVGVLSSRLLP